MIENEDTPVSKPRVFTHEDLNVELARLDPRKDGKEFTTSEIDYHRDVIMVWWGMRDERDDDEILSFERGDLADLISVIKEIPIGAPIAEGEDGSLWEILITACFDGCASAREYLRQHHGEPSA